MSEGLMEQVKRAALAFGVTEAQWEHALAAERPKQASSPRELEREIARLRSAIWAYFTLGPDRRAQAEGILRSALPDDYGPVGA